MSLPVGCKFDEQTILPLATKTSFGLAGSSFQLPDYENVETFVERLLREEMLVADPVVQAVLAGHMPEMSLRTRASVVSCWRPD